MKPFRTFVAAGLLAALVIVGAGCGKRPAGTPSPGLPAASGPLRIGWIGPLTGDDASLGKDALAAAKAAVDDINAGGGVKGRQVELVAEDGKCSPEAALAAAEKLISVEKVQVIIGGVCSEETLAIAPRAEEMRVVLFSGCSSAPAITAAGDHVFRSHPSDRLQGKFAAQYAYGKLGKRKAAVLADPGDRGQGMKNAFIEAFKGARGEVVESLDYAQDGRDLRAKLARIKASGADLVYFVGDAETSVAGLALAQELALGLPLLGTDAWDDAMVRASGAAEGAMYAVPAPAPDAAWTAKMKERGVPVGRCAPRNYDNVRLIAEIVGGNGESGEAIKERLYGTVGWPGVGGPITLDANGDLAAADYDVMVVRGGKAEKND